MGVWVDSTNTNIYAATSNNEDLNGMVRKIKSTTAVVTTFAGGVIEGNDGSRTYGDGKLATNAQLIFPVSVTGDSVGNMFILESGGVRKVDVKSGIISTIANTVPYYAMALWSDPLGNLYDGYKVYPAHDPTHGVILSTGTAPTTYVYGIFGNTAGDLYYAQMSRVVKVSPNAWPDSPKPTADKTDSAGSNTIIIIAVVVAVGGVLVLLALGVFCYRRHNNSVKDTTSPVAKISPQEAGVDRSAYSSVNKSAKELEMTESQSIDQKIPSAPPSDIEHGSIEVHAGTEQRL